MCACVCMCASRDGYSLFFCPAAQMADGVMHSRCSSLITADIAQVSTGIPAAEESTDLVIFPSGLLSLGWILGSPCRQAW